MVFFSLVPTVSNPQESTCQENWSSSSSISSSRGLISHFGMGGKFEVLPMLPFCDSSYSCNWKLDSFGADLMWLMCAFSQYVSLGSLDTLNTGKLISRRASLGCFSSVEVWWVEHVTALPANRATQSASRGWETIKFSKIGYMHICSHRDRICNVSFGCFSNESFTSVSFEVGCCLVAEMIVCWGVLWLVNFFLETV